MADVSTLILKLKNKSFNRGLKQSENKVETLSKSGIGLGKIFGAIAFGVAAKKILGFGASSVKAFSIQEDAVNSLDAAISNTGQSATFSMKNFKDFASSLQEVTTFGDEAIISQAAFLTNLGVSEDQLQGATKAAIGLAETYRIDLKTAANLVGRASKGQTQTLSRYGIVLKEGATDQEKFNQLLEIGAGNFKLAEAAALTTSGIMKQASNTWGDLKETIGSVIVQVVDFRKVFGFVKGIIKSVQNTIERFDIGKLFGGFVDMWLTLNPFVRQFKLILSGAKWVLESMGITFGDVQSSASSFFRTALGFVANFSENWKTLTKFLSTNWHTLIMDLASVWGIFWGNLLFNAAISAKKITAILGAVSGWLADNLFTSSGFNSILQTIFDFANKVVGVFVDMGVNAAKGFIDAFTTGKIGKLSLVESFIEGSAKTGTIGDRIKEAMEGTGEFKSIFDGMAGVLKTELPKFNTDFKKTIEDSRKGVAPITGGQSGIPGAEGRNNAPRFAQAALSGSANAVAAINRGNRANNSMEMDMSRTAAATEKTNEILERSAFLNNLTYGELV